MPASNRFIISAGSDIQLEYSFDNGKTWIEYDNSGRINIDDVAHEGGTILLRGIDCYGVTFTIQTVRLDYQVSGDINSLLNGIGGPVAKTGFGPFFDGGISSNYSQEGVIDSGSFSSIQLPEDVSLSGGNLGGLLFHQLKAVGDGEDFSRDYLYLEQNFPVNLSGEKEFGGAVSVTLRNKCELAFWCGFDSTKKNTTGVNYIDSFTNVNKIIVHSDGEASDYSESSVYSDLYLVLNEPVQSDADVFRIEDIQLRSEGEQSYFLLPVSYKLVWGGAPTKSQCSVSYDDGATWTTLNVAEVVTPTNNMMIKATYIDNSNEG